MPRETIPRAQVCPQFGLSFFSPIAAVAAPALIESEKDEKVEDENEMRRIHGVTMRGSLEYVKIFGVRERIQEVDYFKGKYQRDVYWFLYSENFKKEENIYKQFIEKVIFTDLVG